MNDDRVDHLLALAALGEISPDDQRELERLAAADPEVARELDDVLETAAVLGGLVAEPAPSTMRDRVLSAIADEPQEPALSVVDGGRRDHAPRRVSSGRRTHRRRRGVRGRWMMTAAAAALVLTVGSIVLVVDRAVAPDRMDEVLDAGDAELRRLEGSLDGELVVVQSDDVGAFVIDGNVDIALSDEETLVLWFMPAGFQSLDEATPAAEFRPGEEGDVEQRVDGVDLSGHALGVTVERIGEIDTPTEPVLATA